jgi:hypothetical protein
VGNRKVPFLKSFVKQRGERGLARGGGRGWRGEGVAGGGARPRASARARACFCSYNWTSVNHGLSTRKKVHVDKILPPPWGLLGATWRLAPGTIPPAEWDTRSTRCHLGAFKKLWFLIGRKGPHTCGISEFYCLCHYKYCYSGFIYTTGNSSV